MRPLGRRPGIHNPQSWLWIPGSREVARPGMTRWVTSLLAKRQVLCYRQTGTSRESHMSLFDMAGKVAVITGSTRGIGRAIAERMAEHGAKVVISSRKQDVCDAVAKELNERFGAGTAAAVAANISSKENLQNLVDEANSIYGQIDVLVCNAA